MFYRFTDTAMQWVMRTTPGAAKPASPNGQQFEAVLVKCEGNEHGAAVCAGGREY